MIKKKKVKENVTEKNTSKIAKKTGILESNWIVRITALVILVPIVIVAVLLLTSMDKSGEPVVGKRFNNQLVNEIEKSHINEIEEALTYDNVDSVQVNLKSATLRILIDTNDALDAASIEAIANDAYAKVTAILPIDTYFTNLTENEEIVKMYDLEINVYNLIPEDASTTSQIYAVKYKNASAPESGFDWVSMPKNEEVTDSLLNTEE